MHDFSLAFIILFFIYELLFISFWSIFLSEQD